MSKFLNERLMKQRRDEEETAFILESVQADIDGGEDELAPGDEDTIMDLDETEVDERINKAVDKIINEDDDDDYDDLAIDEAFEDLLDDEDFGDEDDLGDEE
jgi:hypothetical protein